MKPRINHALVEAITETRDVARDAYIRWTWILCAIRGRTDLDRAVACVERARRKLPLDHIMIVDIWGWS